MGFLDRFRKSRVDEALAPFIRKGESAMAPDFYEARAGEGVEYIEQLFGVQGLSSFNLFYNNYINRIFQNEVQRIEEYRRMAEMPEIADVVEDAVIESTQEDMNGDVLHLELLDDEISNNNNIVELLNQQFHELFYDRIDIQDRISEMMRQFLIDGRIYYERLINTKKKEDGIVNIKILPSETMDFEYDFVTGKIQHYFQYLATRPTKPATLEQALEDPSIIVFYPEQIGLIDYGIYGVTRGEILGYLEKVKVPYNQLKLLETSVIIYRIIRSPERFVFKIDTGQMPRDKAIKYVESVKRGMTKKQTYDPSSGRLTNEADVISIVENFFLPTSSTGRGSDITSIGGNPAGFTQLDDIYYFARKLYRALKYPMSRVHAKEDKADKSITIVGTPTGEIARDEIKWSIWLEKLQNKFCNEFRDLFLLHLEFQGLKQEYDLDKSSLKIRMNPPSFYKERQHQMMLETRFSNYSTLSSHEEFSKYYLMQKYLQWTEDDIQENVDAMKKDLEYGFKQPVPELGSETGLPDEEVSTEDEGAAGNIFGDIVSQYKSDKT